MPARCLNIIENIGASRIDRAFHFLLPHKALTVTVTCSAHQLSQQYTRQNSTFEPGIYKLIFHCGRRPAGKLTLSINTDSQDPLYLLVSWNPLNHRLTHSIYQTSASFAAAAAHYRLRFPDGYH